MRLLKQALLMSFMLLASIVLLNLARVGRRPLQGQAGGGQPSIRNGDTDCDGKINITDALLTLNWLFDEGPEPCLAQVEPSACDSLREEIASLRATVETLATRLPGPQNIVEFRGEVAFPAQGGELPAITVPQDKWLILTSAESEAPLVRSLNGETVPIQGLNGGPGSPFGVYPVWSTGHVIPPGSVIILSYPQSYFDPPAPFTRKYYLNGYFVSQ
jgi:hypothetical protein